MRVHEPSARSRGGAASPRVSADAAPAKLHDKISGTFRSSVAARAYATILSYLGTADKHGKNLHDVLVALFSTGAWMPPDAAPG